MLIYNLVIALFYGILLLLVTYLIIGIKDGDTLHGIDMDHYVIASILLYALIIIIFLYLLRAMTGGKD